MASKLKIVAGIGLGGILLVGVVIGGGIAWGYSAARKALTQKFEVHDIDFPVPFPLSEEEIAELRAERLASANGEVPEGSAEADPLEGVDLDALARERAADRGKHLVQARYACEHCHGADFAGATMIDDPAIGTLLGPNITPAGKVKGYTVNDWDRAIRHCVLTDGTPSVMPCEDFRAMSDQELSDIIVYLGTLPPVEKEVPKSTFGPVGTMLLATGQMPLSAAIHPDHMAPHPSKPPPTAETVEFGMHLLQVCTGCHRSDLNGGPMPFGPPDWPAAANLTPHEQGLAGWTYEHFAAAMLEAKRPDGTPLRPPMSDMVPMAQNMTETELKAMWKALQALPSTPLGQ